MGPLGISVAAWQGMGMDGLLRRVEEKVTYWPWDAVQAGPLRVSPMGIGTWAWGNQLVWGYSEAMDAELQECFNLAVQRGVRLVDTADSYGTGRLSGRSEELLGRFLKECPSSRAKDGLKVATKIAAYPWRLTGGQMVEACRKSARRVGVQCLGLGQLHWSTARYAPFQERALWEGLAGMYEQGLVEAVGVSNYGPAQLLRIHNFLRRRQVPIATAQIQFSLLSYGPVQKKVKAICDDLGMKVIAYSPLGLGMLTGAYSSEYPGGPRGLLFRRTLPGMRPLMLCLRQIAQARRKSCSQVAINWCICKGCIPIPGVKNLAQAKDNLGAMSWKLSAGEIRALDSAASAVPRPMLQNIFQTD